MSTSHTTEAPSFVCASAVAAFVRSTCKGLEEYQGTGYCVLHYPYKNKVAAFNEALNRKLSAQDFNFNGVWFPDNVDFSGFTFTKSAYFMSATFSARTSFDKATFGVEAFFLLARFFSEAYFNHAAFISTTNFIHAKFSAGGYFGHATFRAEAHFGDVTFSAAEANFRSAAFDANASFASSTFSKGVDFGSATFSAGVDFSSAIFNEKADFWDATFKDYVRFAGYRKNLVFSEEASLNLQLARIDKPDRFSFHTIKLCPHWFVGVDARKFEFIKADWNWYSLSSKLKGTDVLPGYQLLAIACRNLAANAEENQRYEEASKFRYMAMEAGRLERWRGFAFWTLGWWYWLASGYGERVWRAFVVLIIVWLLAAAVYTRVGFVRWESRVSSEQEAWGAKRDEVGQPLRWQRALTYSLGVMALQKPEPRPATDAAQAVVMLETILGPVQAALLALAIRRKFMR